MIEAFFCYPENGTDYDIEESTRLLEKNQRYEVDYIVVYRSHTDVFLKDFSHDFNSVQFEFFWNDYFVDFDELIWDENRPRNVINLCDSKDAKRFWQMVNEGDWKYSYYI